MTTSSVFKETTVSGSTAKPQLYGPQTVKVVEFLQFYVSYYFLHYINYLCCIDCPNPALLLSVSLYLLSVSSDRWKLSWGVCSWNGSR